MLRKIGFGLLCITASLSSFTYAAESQAVQLQGITVDYELVPNQPLVITNYMFWTVEANCRIVTDDDSNQLRVVGQAKKGKVNDIPIIAGQSLYLTVHPNEHLKLSADSGAKVEITNLSEHTITAVCTA